MQHCRNSVPTAAVVINNQANNKLHSTVLVHQYRGTSTGSTDVIECACRREHSHSTVATSTTVEDNKNVYCTIDSTVYNGASLPYGTEVLLSIVV